MYLMNNKVTVLTHWALGTVEPREAPEGDGTVSYQSLELFVCRVLILTRRRSPAVP